MVLSSFIVCVRSEMNESGWEVANHLSRYCSYGILLAQGVSLSKFALQWSSNSAFLSASGFTSR